MSCRRRASPAVLYRRADLDPTGSAQTRISWQNWTFGNYTCDRERVLQRHGSPLGGMTKECQHEHSESLGKELATWREWNEARHTDVGHPPCQQLQAVVSVSPPSSLVISRLRSFTYLESVGPLLAEWGWFLISCTAEEFSYRFEGTLWVLY